MPAANKQSRSDASVTMRIPPLTKSLIEDAAKARGTTLTAFVLECARREAEDVLLERRVFALSDTDYDAFVAALDAPPREIPALRELLQRKAPWE